jgi:hypothetical protein
LTWPRLRLSLILSRAPQSRLLAVPCVPFKANSQHGFTPYETSLSNYDVWSKRLSILATRISISLSEEQWQGVCKKSNPDYKAFTIALGKGLYFGKG